MKVRDRMSAPPVTIAPGASVQEALTLMREYNVRHLPVLDDGRLVGLVNDIELRTAYFPSLLEELSVADLMNREPVTIQAGDTVYQAARLIHNFRLTGLPVLDGEALVGVITLADILRVLVEVLGLLEASSRVDVTLGPGDSLDAVHHQIVANGGQVISVAQLSGTGPRRVYTFRLAKTDTAHITEALARAGYEVVS